MKKSILLLLLFLLSSIVSADTQQITEKFFNLRSSSDFVPGEVIVKFKSSFNPAGSSSVTGISSVDSLNYRFSVSSIKKISESNHETLSGVYKLTFPHEVNITDIVYEYSNNPFVEYAEPNYFARIFVIPNDANYSSQWAHEKIGSESAWDIERGNEGVVIAIIDSGVDWDHPDLAANIWNNTGEVVDGIDNDGNGYIDDIRGWDFVNTTENCTEGEDCVGEDNNPMDFNGHGTHCSGIAAAVSNNSEGIAGVCWYCKIMPLKAGYDNLLEYVDTAEALVYAADNGADVVSMSWGGFYRSSLIQDSIEYARNKGVVLVAAAGNDGMNIKSYPASYDNVLSVAASGEDDARKTWSNFGSSVDVLAPGGSILSTLFNDSYASWSGTSMATPHVAGLAGLILSKNQSFSPIEVRTILRSTTDQINETRHVGTGRINASQALNVNKTCLAEFNSSIDGAFFTDESSLTVFGTANCTSFGNYSLWFGEGIYPNNWTLVINSTTLVVDGTIGLLNITDFETGWYTLKLVSIDGWGNQGVDMAVFHKQNFEMPGGMQEGWPITVNASIPSSVTTGDIDGDDTPELLAYARNGFLHVWHANGTVVNGWPVFTGELNNYSNALLHLTSSSPVLDDIDNDGITDIIQAGLDGKVYVFQPNGSLKSGWPVEVYSYEDHCISAEPVVDDVNGDGYADIILLHLGNAFIYNYSGHLLDGFPLGKSGSHWMDFGSSPAVADIDGNTFKEFVFGRNTGELINGTWWNYSLIIDAVNYDGSDLQDFPFVVNSTRVETSTYSSPALGDLDQDGFLEIVISSRDNKLYVIDNQGSTKPGWPVNVSYLADGDPILADFDADGNLEIVVGHLGGFDGDGLLKFHVSIYYQNGTIYPNWPVNVSMDLAGSFGPAIIGPVVGDVDGDSSADIIGIIEYPDFSLNPAYTLTKIYAWNITGDVLPGWPLEIPPVQSSPVVADIDNDGDVEVIFAPQNQVYVMDLNASYNPKTMYWPMFHQNNQNTGLYEIPKNSQLTLWDETDLKAGGLTAYPGTQVSFYANYTNITSNQFINSNCTIEFNTNGSWSQAQSMLLNNSLCSYTRSFDTTGYPRWRVNCTASGLGYDTVSLESVVAVSEETTTSTITMMSGWNLISLPLVI